MSNTNVKVISFLTLHFSSNVIRLADIATLTEGSATEKYILRLELQVDFLFDRTVNNFKPQFRRAFDS